MSKISQEFINNLGSLYEEIHVRDQDFLNEESEYYDEETTELVEDIFSSISLSMVYEGYSANAIIGFLADSSEEEIVEKYLSFDENILTESTVSEEYIEEQLEILNEFVGALFRVGKALVKGAKYAKGAKGAAPLTRLASGLKSAGTATERIAKQGPKASSVVRSTLSKGVQKVKDIAKGVKAKLTGPTAKKVALGALAAGTGVLTGYAGAKLGGAGQGAPKPTPSDVQAPSAPSVPSSQASSASSSQSSSTPSSKPSATGDVNKKYQELRKKDPESAKKYGLEQWAKANPKLADKVKPDGTQKGTGQSQMEKDAEELRRATNRSKQRQGELMGGPEGPGKIDTKSVDDSIKAETERLKKSAEKKANEKVATTKESYDAYDIVLEYLINSDQVKTLEEAHYVMLEMDSQTIGNIVRSNKI